MKKDNKTFNIIKIVLPQLTTQFGAFLGFVFVIFPHGYIWVNKYKHKYLKGNRLIVMVKIYNKELTGVSHTQIHTASTS